MIQSGFSNSNMQKNYFYCCSIYTIELVNFNHRWMRRSSRISYSHNAVSWFLLSFSKRRLCHLDSHPGAYLAVCAHPYPKALEISSHFISISFSFLIFPASGILQDVSESVDVTSFNVIFLNPLNVMVCIQTLFISRDEYYYTFYSAICLWYFIFLLMHIESFQNFTIINTVMINIT